MRRSTGIVIHCNNFEIPGGFKIKLCLISNALFMYTTVLLFYSAKYHRYKNVSQTGTFPSAVTVWSFDV